MKASEVKKSYQKIKQLHFIMHSLMHLSWRLVIGYIQIKTCQRTNTYFTCAHSWNPLTQPCLCLSLWH
jgi:hypothetical protein